MSTLIRIPASHMRFVPAHPQSDDMTASISLAKRQVELVLIFDAAGHETYLDHSRNHGILALAIQDVCRMTTAQTKFFPLMVITSNEALPHPGRHPTCPSPRCPPTLPAKRLLAPITPPRGLYTGTPSGYLPNMGQARSHRLHRDHLRVLELCGGLATGLEALLRDGYTIHCYV
jgi:hypothetical protein